MRLYGRMCGLSQTVIANFLPTNFIAAQNASKSDTRVYKTIRNVLETKKQMSILDWRKLSKICCGHGFGYQAYYALVSRDPSMSEVRKLFSAFHQEKIFTLILKAQTLQVFKIYESECTEDDHKFILDTVEEIIKKFQILTPQIVRPMLFGVGVTPEWKEQCELLRSKLTTIDSSVYELTALAAFHHRDFNYAWDQVRKAASVTYGDNWAPELFHGIVQSHRLHPKEGILSKLFEIIEEYSLMLPVGVAEEIDQILNEDTKTVSRYSTVSLSGHCSCCEKKLRKIPLTSEEQKNLLESVEKRFDVDCKFVTYEEKELRHFKMFLKVCPPYTVVIDGANIYYRNKADSKDFNTAKKAVKQLEEAGHKILLIGRNHMKQHKLFTSLFKKHTTYYVKDRSVDDAYVIYAAVSSGPNTIVVSNDYFGTYYADMPQESRLVFRKWQLSNQVVCTGYLASYLVFPEISPICQKSEDGSSLHIPVVPNASRHTFAPAGWLCVQHVTTQQKKKSDKLWPVRKFDVEETSNQYAFRNHAHSIKHKVGTKLANSVRN